MRKYIAIIICILACVTAWGQKKAPEGYSYKDSLVYRRVPDMDTSLVGRSIFSVLPSKESGAKAVVNVNQSQEIRDAFASQMNANRKRSIRGYRLRIYYDKGQSARNDSEAAVNRIKSMYPGISTYRSFRQPYFVVTAGDFRTRSEAMRVLTNIKAYFPSAKLLKENINYPPVDNQSRVRVDTVKVLRKND